MSYSNRLLSKEMITKIREYYIYLNNNYEQKTIEEICDDNCICRETLNAFLHENCPKSSEEINKLGLIILLCTKFGKHSPYRNIQKQYLNEIKNRELKKIVKEKCKNLK